MLSKFSIKKKLFFVNSVILIIGVLGIITTVSTMKSNTNEIMQFKHMLVLSQKLSLLVHETQKERGASAGFVGSKGEKFIQELPKQRLLTNRRIAEYHAYVKLKISLQRHKVS